MLRDVGVSKEIVTFIQVIHLGMWQELGSAYIDNSELISAVKKKCIVLADDQANDAEIKEAITVIENDYCAEPLSDEQSDTLLNVIVYPYLKSLGRSGKIENALLNDKKKLAYFLLGHIKRKCKTDDTITLPIAQIKEWCGGDAKTVKHLTYVCASDIKTVCLEKLISFIV